MRFSARGVDGGFGGDIWLRLVFDFVSGSLFVAGVGFGCVFWFKLKWASGSYLCDGRAFWDGFGRRLRSGVSSGIPVGLVGWGSHVGFMFFARKVFRMF